MQTLFTHKIYLVRKKSNFDGTTFHISQELYGETSAAPIIHLKRGYLAPLHLCSAATATTTVLQTIKSRLWVCVCVLAYIYVSCSSPIYIWSDVCSCCNLQSRYTFFSKHAALQFFHGLFSLSLTLLYTQQLSRNYTAPSICSIQEREVMGAKFTFFFCFPQLDCCDLTRFFSRST